MKILFALAVLYLSMVGRVFSAEPVFEKLTLTEEFYSEGIAVADIDRDGHRDIVSGPFWYRGPDFRVRQRYASGDALSIQGYSKHFFTWTCDFNEDGHVDILTVGMPGEPAFWFQLALYPISQTLPYREGQEWVSVSLRQGNQFCERI